MSAPAIRAPLANRPAPALPTRRPTIVRQSVPAAAPASDSSVHPIAVMIPAFAAAWLVAGSWIVFAHGTAILPMVMVTVILVMYGGLLLGGGASARNVTAVVKRRNFEAFLDGSVEIQTGTISGHDALVQMAVLPLALVVGGTVILAIAAAIGF